MAVLYITEYERLAEVPGIAVQSPQEPAVAEQNVAIGGGSLQSAAFNARTRFIMVHTDAICAIAFGDNPTAAATAKRHAANETRFYGVAPGQKLAVITAT